jgi:hypothetical protein
MWTWIYYITITIMSLNICSTVAIVQMMATAGDVQEELVDKHVLNDNRADTVDIESGGRDAMHHRKSRANKIAF